MLTKKAPPKASDKTVKSVKSNSDQTKTAVETLLKSSLNTKPVPPSSFKVEPSTAQKSRQKTKITIKYNAGFSNELFIRGKGAGLNWEKGQKLINVCADEWIWETDQRFSKCEFKILLNDATYEKDENHLLNEGACMQFTPNFS